MTNTAKQINPLEHMSIYIPRNVQSSVNLEQQPNSDSKAISDNAEFYNRNSNSAYYINPSKMKIIPNYDDKYYTNINDPNNLAPKIPQTRSQSLDMYNYSPENIQAVSSDLKYDDNTYPSDTQLYDMSSSPVYY